MPLHRSRAHLAAALAALLVSTLAVPAFAVTSEDLAESRAKAAQAREAAKKAEALAGTLAKQTAALDDKIDVLESEVAELDPRIEQATAASKRLRFEVAQLRIKVAQKSEQIDSTRKQFTREQGLLDERIEVTYKQGDLYYLDLVLGSHDIGDLIVRTELVRRVIRSNQSLAENLLRTKADLEAAKVELDRTLDSVQIKRAEAEQVEADLKTLRERRRNRVDEQQAIYQDKSELLAETKANARKYRAIAEEEERESSRIAAELAAASQGGGHYNGVMGWPVPSSYNVTSPYGYRIHPIFHTRKLHTGVDIGAGSGSAIMAAGDGQVIYAGYRGGYGNTVMIDHGDGVVTLYAHQQSGGIRVSDGQRVAKGDRIGTVGSTGFSTGPHLHFEVRVNGAPTDPMAYLR